MSCICLFSQGYTYDFSTYIIIILFFSRRCRLSNSLGFYAPDSVHIDDIIIIMIEYLVIRQAHAHPSPHFLFSYQLI